jgi:lipopolysaccharide biosynthesis glycosyltransferase
MAKNLLVTLADRNFVAQARQLFSSAYWNAGWQGDYMLLACDIPEAELEWFRKKNILVSEVKPFSREGLGDKAQGYSATVTSKLALFSVEFKKWNVVVFIDADCIVRYPLDAVTKTKGFAAAGDWLENALIRFQIKNWQGMSEAEFDKKFEGYSSTATAFNTGFFAFNTAIIKDDTQAGLKLLLDRYLDLSRFGEQLAVNLFFYKKWRQLPMEFNLLATYLNIKRHVPKKTLDGVVLHFPRFGEETGTRCWDKENAYFDEWRNNLERAELMDLTRIPKLSFKWPTLKHVFYDKWMIKLALRADYLRLYRSKIALCTRVSRLLSTLKIR